MIEHRPILGITMGDPFGNGPEITIKALSDKEVYKRCKPLVIGDMACMDYALKVSGLDLVLHKVRDVDEAYFNYGIIDVLDLEIVKPSDIPGKPEEKKPFKLGPTTLGGEAAFQYVVKVIELAMEKKVDATITNALSKEAINMGIRDAIEFGPFLIVNGKSASITGNGGYGIHPRSAIGQRQDGIVLFLVIDGENYIDGASLQEVVDVLMKYGAYNAANLDGGHSSSLSINGKLYNNPPSIAKKQGGRYVVTGFGLLK